ncbi:MAG TPA: hypothetical protein DDW49_01865 [Deltaproteobacteria bacterium]|nr:MAG: hypothetical protein A2048_10025 [Deltaproteobacteria bacterium GWA2_45_12]HBF12130.1 hypothetical protein [Deltaproteobacteria bacterium]
MGICIVEKNTSLEKIPNPKLALVLAGGAISGGAFKVGGLKALNDFLVNRKVTNFDIYVGLSAGAFLAAPLAGGIPPEEMLASLDGKSRLFSQLSLFNLYKPNFEEIITRPLKYVYGHFTFVPGIIYDLCRSAPQLKRNFWNNLKRLVLHPSYSNYEELMAPILRVMYATRSIPQLEELLPSGIFDNAPIEKFVRQNMRRNRMTNHFKVLKKMSGKSLYITAMNVDTAERVIFGPDEKSDITISQAIQASSAIPGFYKPVRLKGIDYTDGGVDSTANIDIAFAKGADVVICYNPFRPFSNEVVVEYLREENRYITKNKQLADWGLSMVLNQIFRSLLHARLMQSIETYKNDATFKKDIIIIQPKQDDNEFFELNPIFFWNRAKAALRGFHSVSQSIEQDFDRISSIMSKYGVTMTRDIINLDEKRMEKTKNDTQKIMDILEQTHTKNRLKIVQSNTSKK